MLSLLVAIALTPSEQVSDLAWMAGHWLECTPRGETSETWTDARGGVMLGVSKTVRAGRTSWESTRIDVAPEGLTLFASPKGQEPTAFRTVSVARDRVVFENTGHDFPQRVIYTRQGDRLIGRIEGTVDGRPRSIEWHYRSVPLNAACPVSMP